MEQVCGNCYHSSFYHRDDGKGSCFFAQKVSSFEELCDCQKFILQTSKETTNVFSLLTEIMSLLASLTSSNFALQAGECVVTNLISGGGFAGILSCISGLTTETVEEQVVQAKVVRLLDYHVTKTPNLGKPKAK
jgi:hypothetical protein